MGVIKLSPKYRIHDGRIFYSARKILKQTYGDDADFREGQYEAIESVMMRKRTLVVQRTGWGKSLVYFISAKMLRKKKRNLTMVVSPLLVLMDNQREMAEKLNLKCDVLNSTVKDRRAEIIDSLIHDELDVIFVTPETLFASDIQSSLHKIKVGLFVIDEAHCISDWGHDFRLEYGKLGRIISAMPANVSVLAVTATANDRVVNDLRSQLGDDVYVSRGKLTRESLHIQILRLDTRAKRYAWLLENLNKLPGTGIIYCLTRRNCEELSEFLNAYGLNTMPYYSGNDEKLNEEAIEKFHGNKIKAVIATVKLGMG
ncbi:MAG: ATP-dependent DNA helicase RecQ, partial [Synergistaceae bacterium]|nr:ATP-dependent DNA helicase RecQ [Synergistaceae bacterium]